MERLSYEFTNALAQKTRVLLIANRHGKKALPVFLLWAAWKLRQLAPQADVIHLGDPLLTVLLPFIPTPRKPVAVTVHGLDIRYPSSLYQALLRRFLPRVNLVICISRFVETEARRRFPNLRTTVIQPGVSESFALPKAAKADLERVLGRTLGAGPLLLAVARLVPRKGIAWFVTHVLRNIQGVTLLVLGDGPERKHIVEASEQANVSSRIVLAGAVEGTTLTLAYNVADLLVMPNIPVAGDAEGFGLVALEAASAGLPVVASSLEGITDAVREGETGFFLPAGRADAWTSTISRLLNDRVTRERIASGAPTAVHEHYGWDQRANEVLFALSRLTECPV